MRLKYAFVETVPDTLEPETLYISIPYATAVHACLCGCGEEVVTPLSPVDWAFTFDGEAVSLYPSIGSWSLPCQSHYWIHRSEVLWSDRWKMSDIEQGREVTRRAKASHHGKLLAPRDEQHESSAPWWKRLAARFR